MPLDRLAAEVQLLLLHHTMNRVIARLWRKAFDRYALMPGLVS